MNFNVVCGAPAKAARPIQGDDDRIPVFHFRKRYPLGLRSLVGGTPISIFAVRAEFQSSRKRYGEHEEEQKNPEKADRSRWKFAHGGGRLAPPDAGSNRR